MCDSCWFHFSVSFLCFHSVHYHQTSHQNTYANTPVVLMFCQGENHGSVTITLFFQHRVPQRQHNCNHASRCHGRDYWLLKPPPVYRGPDAKDQLSLKHCRKALSTATCHNMIILNCSSTRINKIISCRCSLTQVLFMGTMRALKWPLLALCTHWCTMSYTTRPKVCGHLKSTTHVSLNIWF